MSQTQTAVTYEGQPYFDEEVIVKQEVPDVMHESIAAAFGRPIRKPPIVVGHQRVNLRWMKPGPDGKLVPK